ncbi:MAG: Ig-like domain-containing protein [Myxococcota bacterium]
MKTSSLYRISWLVPLLAGCADDAAVSPSTGTGTDGTTSAMADSTSGDGAISATFAEDETVDGTTTGGDDTGSTGSSGSTGTTGSNAAPEAVDDVYYTRQAVLLDEPADGLLANDTDPDGDALTVTEFDAVSVAGATVVVEADGAFTYEPLDAFWGNDSFTYTIEDPSGDLSLATVSLFVAPVAIALSEVAAGNGGYVLNGEAGGQAGSNVSAVGDLNGDGMSDFVISAPFTDTAVAEGGRTYVVFGKADTDPVELGSLGDGGFIAEGTQVNQRAGISTRGAGDVNGDGLGDVVIGAPVSGSVGTNSGQSFVVFGTDQTATIDLNALGSSGFAINAEAAGDFSGYSVSGAGDVDGDGLADLLVGATGVDANGINSGRSYVVFGKANTDAVDLAALGAGGYALQGEAEFDASGRALAGPGDLDGDGLADIVIGAPLADAAGDEAGRSYVVFGKDTDTDPVELSALGIGGFVMDGPAADDNSGFALGAAGDVNGDGVPDMIVGSDGAASGRDTGVCQVVFGSDATDALDLGALGTAGFAVNGEAAEDRFAFAVSGAGDVNGDGLDDIIVGAYAADQTATNAGRAYVVYGKDSAGSVSVGALDEGGFSIDGEAEGDGAGFSVSGAGDVNGDGVDDIMVGANDAAPNGAESGRVYIVFGVPTGPPE